MPEQSDASMPSPPPDETAHPDVLTVDEAAIILRVERKTLYRAIRLNNFPARHIGGVIRISRTALLEWLAGNGRVSSSRSRR